MQNSAKSVFGAMILLIQHLPHLHSTVAKREQFYDKFYSKLRHFPHLCSFKFNSKAPLKCFCSKNQTTHEAFQGFSALPRDTPWDNDTVWSTMALYIFSLHIPLSLGSLSLVSQLMHMPILDPQTKALSRLAIQTLEFILTLLLLKLTAKPNYRFRNFFRDNELCSKRNWIFASAFGVGFLLSLVFLTSLLAERVIGPKAVSNLVLKEILDCSNISRTACFIAYCVVTPFLEETVYRGFLLASISSEMQWQQAVVISSAVFSAAHLSVENSLQLFIIGCVLGCSYCWTGNLRSSILIHSLYNAMTLLLTYLS
ncbi:hypothetical protein IC582_000899 [Cucumis melo]|uniref:Uncharacterized protein LOC103500400 isoform X1 n=2 Tax=Cucumis melo TaxID=3656 RepID=A0A1S3CFT6_CUCME|nr:uncharacterized protein LOC103500400 isoform X1 [Cucumis melo]